MRQSRWVENCAEVIEMRDKKVLIAVSGVKNSGKTTLITRLLPILTGYGLKVATIKHDGHDFEGDVPGTDTYRHMQAGAYGTAVFSGSRFMAVKQQPDVTEQQLCELFPEADLILLEGFKNSRYPKIETLRQCVSRKPVCSREGLLAYVADFDISDKGEIPRFSAEEPGQAAQLIYDYWYCCSQMSMVILAGGKSSRMGRDKADLLLHGKTFLQLQILKGEALGIQDIVVSGYGGTICERPVVFDRYPGRGPLGGLESAMRKVRHHACLVLTVDMPLISISQLQGVITESRTSGHRITVLKHREQIEPLVGVYSKELADEIQEYLYSGEAKDGKTKVGKVRRLLDDVGFDVYESQGEEALFLNINDQETYEKAESLFKSDTPAQPAVGAAGASSCGRDSELG